MIKSRYNHQKIAVVDKSDFIDDAIKLCSRNDFSIARGFTPHTEIPFDPRVIIFGIVYDNVSGQPYTNPKLKNILSDLINDKSILVGEGSDKTPTQADKELYKNHPFYPFVGNNTVRFVDNAQVFNALEEMSMQQLESMTRDERSKNYLAPGVLKATEDVDISGRVFIAMNIWHFIDDERHILRALENNNQSYALICPNILLLPKNYRGKINQDEYQIIYKQMLRKTAQIDLR